MRLIFFLAFIFFNSCASESLFYKRIAEKDEPCSISMFLATQTKEADCISVEISNTSLDTLIFPYIGDTCLFYDEDNAIRIDFAEYIEQHCEMIYEIHPPIAALNEFLIPNKLHGNYLIRFVIIPPHQKSRFYFKGYLKKNHSYNLDVTLIFSTGKKAPLYGIKRYDKIITAYFGTADFWSTANVGTFKTSFKTD